MVSLVKAGASTFLVPKVSLFGSGDRVKVCLSVAVISFILSVLLIKVLQSDFKYDNRLEAVNTSFLILLTVTHEKATPTLTKSLTLIK